MAWYVTKLEPSKEKEIICKAENDLHPNWKMLGTVLLYQSTDFDFKKSIIITEMSNCLLKPMNRYRILNKFVEPSVEVNKEFIIKIYSEAENKSLVLLCNEITYKRGTMYIIKKKLELLTEILDIPILAIFSLRKNCFAKPFTGMWRLLNAYYLQKVNYKVSDCIVVSDNGGLIENMEKKIQINDYDMAFAHNIGFPFYTINEYVDGTVEKKTWNNFIISPETRLLYDQQIKNIENPNIFKLLGEFGKKNSYIIMIIGPPSSGKTRLAKLIIAKWRASKFGEKNAIFYIGWSSFQKFKNCVNDKISVILDNNRYTNSMRNPYIKYAQEYDVPILFIDVNPGIEMAKIFEMAKIETAESDRVYRKNDEKYYMYKSLYERPSVNSPLLKYTQYVPHIEATPQIMTFRY